MKQTGRDMVLWPGSCIVHETFSEKRLVQLKVEHPDAEVVAHPECEEPVLRHADFIGSTKGLLDYVLKSPKQRVHRGDRGRHPPPDEEASARQDVHPGAARQGCACNECPYMRLNTLEKLYLCMRDRTPELRAARARAGRGARPAPAHARVVPVRH